MRRVLRQIAVRELLVAVLDVTVRGDAVLRGDLPLLRRRRDQHLARGGRGVAQRHERLVTLVEPAVICIDELVRMSWFESA